MHRHRSFIKTSLLWGGLLAFGAVAAAQGSGVSITVFSGTMTGVVLGSWGSGRAEADDKVVLLGGESIKITTQGLYQGARIDFRSPLDLARAFQSASSYMRFQFRFAGAGTTTSVFDPLSGATTAATASPFTRMRFLLVMADGSQHEVIRPIDIPPSDDPDSWVSVSFPLSALLKSGKEKKPAPTGQGAQLARLAIFGDKYQQFHLGEVTVLTDETELTAYPIEEQAVATNDLVNFVGGGSGGASSLRYTWDFDASDGIQEDRVGRTVQYFWRKPGTYTVTLTVHDVDGLKKSASTTAEVEVFE